jgi:multisubunit Na+/H+ antiporter MnhB subunit
MVEGIIFAIAFIVTIMAFRYFIDDEKKEAIFFLLFAILLVLVGLLFKR